MMIHPGESGFKQPRHKEYLIVMMKTVVMGISLCYKVRTPLMPLLKT